MLRTYQPKKLHRKKEHGFRKRMSTSNGRKVLARRRAKGRKRLSYVTIKENKTFSRLYRKGKSYVSPVLVTYVLRGRDRQLPPRYGITTGKKVGNAVRRSRARRVIRASYDHLYPEIKKGYEIVFVARAKTPYVKTQDVEKAMRYHLKQAGILIER